MDICTQGSIKSHKNTEKELHDLYKFVPILILVILHYSPSLRELVLDSLNL